MIDQQLRRQQVRASLAAGMPGAEAASEGGGATAREGPAGAAGSADGERAALAAGGGEAAGEPDPSPGQP